MQGFGNVKEVKKRKAESSKPEKNGKREKPGGISELRRLDDQIEQNMRFLANFVQSVETIIAAFKSQEVENQDTNQATLSNILALEPILTLMRSDNEGTIMASDSFYAIRSLTGQFETTDVQYPNYESQFQEDFAKVILLPFHQASVIKGLVSNKTENENLKRAIAFVATCYALLYGIFSITDRRQPNSEMQEVYAKCGEIERIYQELSRIGMINTSKRLDLDLDENELNDNKTRKLKQLKEFTSQNSTKFFEFWLAEYNNFITEIPQLAINLRNQVIFHIAKVDLDKLSKEITPEQYYDTILSFLKNCILQQSPMFPGDDGSVDRGKLDNLTKNLKKLYATNIFSIKLIDWQSEFCLAGDYLFDKFDIVELESMLNQVKSGKIIQPWIDFVVTKLGVVDDFFENQIIYDLEGSNSLTVFITDTLVETVHKRKQEQENTEQFELAKLVSTQEFLNTLDTALNSYYSENNLDYATLNELISELNSVEAGLQPSQQIAHLLDQICQSTDLNNMVNIDMRLKPTFSVLKNSLITNLSRLSGIVRLAELRTKKAEDEEAKQTLESMVETVFGNLDKTKYTFKASCSMDDLLEPDVLKQWREGLTTFVEYLNNVTEMKKLLGFNGYKDNHGEFKSLKFKSLNSSDSDPKYSIRLKPNTVRDRAYFRASYDQSTKSCHIELYHIGVHLPDEAV